MKQTTILNVPNNVKYLGEWKNFKFPNGILNKVVTGCGGTTLALENEVPTVICSPRIKLLENKSEQYPNTLFVKAGVTTDDIKDYISSVKVPKILTTYDSFLKVARCITKDYHILVDECQYIILDATFKGTVTENFLKAVKGFDWVTFLSATPLIEEYIKELNLDLPVYKLNWNNLEKITLDNIITNKPLEAVIKLVEAFEDKNVESISFTENSLKKAKELVIYLNSVTNIVTIIKKAKLRAEDVNIIVANNTENELLIKKLGINYGFGRIPLKGEQNKKYTFCTSTAFAGVDFYSDNALQVVVSDSKISYTTIDIATDLAQIAGRQRNANNPFRSYIILINNLAEKGAGNKFIEMLESDIKQINLYNEDPINNVIHIEAYKKAYNNIADFNGTSFVVKETTVVALQYQHKLIEKVYKNKDLFIQALNDNNFSVDNQLILQMSKTVNKTIKKRGFQEMIKDYIEDGIPCNSEIIKIAKTVGFNKCKALEYRKKEIENEYKNIDKEKAIILTITRIFKTNTDYTAKEVKTKLQAIYNTLNLNKIAKATDLISLVGATKKVAKINYKSVDIYTIPKYSFSQIV